MIDNLCNALAAEFGHGYSRREHDRTKQQDGATSAPTFTDLPPLNKCSSQNMTLLLAAENLADYNVRLRMFLLRLCDPDDLGYSVSAEVRQLAVELATSNRYGKDRCDFHNPTTHDRSTSK